MIYEIPASSRYHLLHLVSGGTGEDAVQPFGGDVDEDGPSD